MIGWHITFETAVEFLFKLSCLLVSHRDMTPKTELVSQYLLHILPFVYTA